MKKRDLLIQEYLLTKPKIGEYFSITGSKRSGWYTLVEGPDEAGNIVLRKEQNIINCNLNDESVTRITDFVGIDPFKNTPNATSYAIDLEQLIWRMGYNIGQGWSLDWRSEIICGVSVPEVNHNPTVLDSEGNEIQYQRGLVWNLEQKQSLISSIWNNVEIGKFVIRPRSFSWVENRIKEGRLDNTSFSDLVDGKQRINSIVSYIKNEFPDLDGVYFDDLSESAKRKMMGYRNISYLQLDENVTDKEVIETFLAINFAGVPMSIDHINFVKSIRIS